MEGLGDQNPLPHHHVPVTPGVRTGERAELGKQLVGEPETDATLAPDHGEDGAAGEEGIAAEHAADRDLGETGGEVIQPGAELEEQGAHGNGRERGGAGVYLGRERPGAGDCFGADTDGGWMGAERCSDGEHVAGLDSGVCGVSPWAPRGLPTLGA